MQDNPFARLRRESVAVYASTYAGPLTVPSWTVTGALAVGGNTTLTGTLAVTGASAFTGAVTMASTLAVTGATTLSAALSGTTGTFSSTLGVTGTLSANTIGVLTGTTATVYNTTATTVNAFGAATSIAIGNAAGNTTITGKFTNNYTESSIADSRPVSCALTYKFTPSSAPGSSLDFHGVDLVGWSDDTDVNANTRIFTFESNAKYAAAGTIGQLVPAYLLSNNSSTGTVNLVKNLRLWHKNDSTGTVTDLNYVYIENPQNSGGGTITTATGIYIEDITTGGTNWGVKSLAPNYMAELGVANGAVALTSKFEVGGSGNANYQSYIKGQGATSGTWALVIQNGSGSSIADFRDDRLATIRNLAVATTALITGDLTLASGNIIASTATTWNVLNTVATTVNAFGAATTTTIGSTSDSTCTLHGLVFARNNASALMSISWPSVDFRIQNTQASGASNSVIRFDCTGAASLIKELWFFRVSPSVAGNIRLVVFSPNTSTENLTIDAKTGNLVTLGTLTFATTLVSSTTTANVCNATATTVNAFGAASVALNIGNASASAVFAGGITIADAKNIVLNTTTGTKIGTATGQKLAFHNSTPTVQYATTGTSTGFTAGAGTTVTHLSTFTGNSGSTAYTIADIVLCLKTKGLMAA